MALNGEVFINNLISGNQRINIHCWEKLDESDKLNRLQGEWECMQMASMIFFTRCYFPPIIWHLICSMCVESIWHTFNWFWNLIVVQGHAKQLLQAKNVFPKSEVFIAKSRGTWSMIICPNNRCICWLGVAMTSWLIPRRYALNIPSGTLIGHNLKLYFAVTGEDCDGWPGEIRGHSPLPLCGWGDP